VRVTDEMVFVAIDAARGQRGGQERPEYGSVEEFRQMRAALEAVLDPVEEAGRSAQEVNLEFRAVGELVTRLHTAVRYIAEGVRPEDRVHIHRILEGQDR